MDELDQRLAPDTFAYLRAAARKLGQHPRYLKPLVDMTLALQRKAYNMGDSDAHDRPTRPDGWLDDADTTPTEDYEALEPDLSKLLKPR